MLSQEIARHRRRFSRLLYGANALGIANGIAGGSCVKRVYTEVVWLRIRLAMGGAEAVFNQERDEGAQARRGWGLEFFVYFAGGRQ